MILRTIAILFTAAWTLAAWDRGKAFQYLETSQRKWADWKHAQRPGGPCISCHTGLSFSFARRAAGETQPRPLERAVIEGVRSRLLETPPRQAMTDAGAEAILNLAMLAMERQDAAAAPGEAGTIALRRLWDLQIKEGKAAGSWSWFAFNLEPWDSATSNYFGAALAARALAAYPRQPEERVDALRQYLEREFAAQPLHNRLARIAFDPTASKADTWRQLWAAQSADGGWTTASLGPWPAQPDAPPNKGSNTYATAWAVFTARESGVACSESKLRKGLDWLARHQDSSTGAWHSVSMNQVYPEGSIQRRFMTDAATGYAAAALLACGR